MEYIERGILLSRPIFLLSRPICGGDQSVLRDAGVVQVGTPEEVYRRPVDAYVAGLFGKYNMIGKTFVRPEDIRILDREGVAAAEGWRALSGKVERVIFQGSYYDIDVQLKNSRLIVRTTRGGISVGDIIYVTMT